ncbi:4'-phosphopantetheinyl transferase family protein [Maribacter sp. 2210JD10-5]|uniref:4'-phosphopantetheinyl transferase family protein n=1 Tax=Maribacter sp. 2210JD10-5 TaxID=3386272 RepID=UPI0039BD5A47
MKVTPNDNCINELHTGELIIWTIDLSESKKGINFFNSILNKAEINKANAFRFDKDRDCYVITRGLLKTLLGFYWNKRPDQIELEYNSFGKPRLPSRYGLKFNVSHSQNFSVICFLKDAEVGIDIENCKRDINLMDLAENFFSKKEVENLKKLPFLERDRAFYRCWTRKEAFIKAEGSGLSFPLKQFAVSLDNDLEAELLNTYWDEKSKDNWTLKSFVPAEGYLAAIATKGKIDRYVFHEWNDLIYQE